VMLIVAGAWAYTDALASLARGQTEHDLSRLLLFLALLVGSLIGGWTAGRLRHTAPSWRALSRSLAGGTMMGLGSVLIPGSNDGLILIGLPLLMPYAILALASMTISIAIGMLIERRLYRRTR